MDVVEDYYTVSNKLSKRLPIFFTAWWTWWT